MKKYFFTFMLPVTMMLGMLVGCGDSSVLQVPQMTMTTAASEVGIQLAGKGEVTIDWGDGTASDKDTLRDDGTFYYEHSYSSSSTRTITITGSYVTELRCYDQLTSLDVSKNSVLELLDCRNNELTSLDVSKNNVLEWLQCWGNQLTILDMSGNPALKVLGCSDNQLTSLDVSKNNVLRVLFCSDNQLTSTALNALFESLHSNTLEGKKQIYIYNNPGENDCNISVAEGKGWELMSPNSDEH